jgi:hypothetical protein
VPGMFYFQSGTCSSSKVDRSLVQVSDQLPPFREVELLVDINPGKWLPYLVLKLSHISPLIPVPTWLMRSIVLVPFYISVFYFSAYS